MADITFGELMQAAQKLNPQQKAALVSTLQADLAHSVVPLSREQAIAELQGLRDAGAFTNVESLKGKYTRPGVEISDQELNAYLHAVGTEWEQELDDHTSSN